MLSESFFDNGISKEEMVLILIVMEHALEAIHRVQRRAALQGLNPYCNGTCSRSVTIIAKRTC